MANIIITFSGYANDNEYTVTFPLDVPADQLMRGGVEWMEREAELWVMNDESIYNEFYDGAEQADMDATLTDIRVEIEDAD